MTYIPNCTFWPLDTFNLQMAVSQLTRILPEKGGQLQYTPMDYVPFKQIPHNEL